MQHSRFRCFAPVDKETQNHLSPNQTFRKSARRPHLAARLSPLDYSAPPLHTRNHTCFPASFDVFPTFFFHLFSFFLPGPEPKRKRNRTRNRNRNQTKTKPKGPDSHGFSDRAPVQRVDRRVHPVLPRHLPTAVAVQAPVRGAGVRCRRDPPISGLGEGGAVS